MHRHPLTPIQEQKHRLRAEMREKRRIRAVEVENASNELASVFTHNVQLEKGAVIATYSAFRNEMNPIALNEALRAQGHKIALPIITGKNHPLIFRLYNPGDLLLASPMGILEPASTAQGVEPDVLLVPMIAFDRGRNRLGYGGGYYDRTINKLRSHKPIRTIGIAYAFQEIAEVPVGRNDIPLDTIVTDQGIF